MGLVSTGVGPAGPGKGEGPGPGGRRGRLRGEQADEGGEGDTVCLDRRDLQDLLRRVRGLERLIGRVLGGAANESGALG